MEKFDFVAIGDTVSDEFIELEDVRIDKDPDEGDKGYDEICFRFGDKVGYKEAELIYAVGNAPNAAVSATRLGLKTAFITDIGSDELGKKKFKTLKDHGIDCRWVETHEGFHSNHHYVLRFGLERTILINHAKYPYELPNDLVAPSWFYFSSVGEHGLAYHHEIAKYLKDHPESKLSFQPGTFQINLGAEKLKDLYEVTQVFFCNKEEAQRILNTKESNIPKLMEGMGALGPTISVITDGPAGAYALDTKTGDSWSVPMYPDTGKPIDRTGAGDAFSSTFTSALARGNDIPTALLWGPINSMNVVQYVGAQEGLLKKEEHEKLLKNAPANYKVMKL